MDFTLVNGIKIYAPHNRQGLLNALQNYQGLLIAVNAEKIIKSKRKLKEIINQNIGYPDGIGSVWAIKQKGLQTLKIPGAELWYDIVHKFHSTKSFYLIGSSEEIISETVEKLKATFANLTIKGWHNGYLSEGQEDALIKDLKNTQADIVMVAMGTPRQEYFMQKAYSEHPALYMGLGGSFDVFTGRKKRAPKIFIKSGMEWFYRLLREPTRIKRQAIFFKFIILLLLRKF